MKRTFMAVLLAMLVCSCCRIGGENYCFSEYASIDNLDGERTVLPGYGDEYFVAEGLLLVRVEKYNTLFKTSEKYTWSEKEKSDLKKKMTDGKGRH